MPHPDPALPQGQAAFQTTRWSLIVSAAGKQPSPGMNEALAELCQIYWYPLYTFVRRRGHSVDDACDLTQGFFSRLLDKNDLAAADQARGRFRSFLLCAMTNFLCNESDRAHALKRGGGTKHVSFTPSDAESRYQLEPATGLTPEKLFDRQWALLLLERVLGEVRGEYERADNLRVFDALQCVITFTPDAPSYQQIASQLGVTEGAVKIAVHRLRGRYRQRLRCVIADSVASEEDVDDEIRHLFEVFAAP